MDYSDRLVREAREVEICGLTGGLKTHTASSQHLPFLSRPYPLLLGVKSAPVCYPSTPYYPTK